MINELYRLSSAMDTVGISVNSWHRKYIAIPRITAKTPCVRIMLKNSHISKIESISEKIGSGIRKYGSNQGTFPAMNLAPLYKITDDTIKEQLESLLKGDTTEIDVDTIRGWCDKNNWEENFSKKYAISMKEVPNEIKSLLRAGEVEYEPFSVILEEINGLLNPSILHSELEQIALLMLHNKTDIILALRILFYINNIGEKGYGSLSIIFDCEKLIGLGVPTISSQFTKEFNKKLLQADRNRKEDEKPSRIDAFRIPFVPSDDPMPGVKLNAGFEVTLRTMFEGQPCQKRYGRIGNDTYPLSVQLRTKLQNALAWLAEDKQKDITWINLGDKEVLFAYPEIIPDSPIEIILRVFAPSRTNSDGFTESKFEKASTQFISLLRNTKIPGEDSRSNGIQFFVLKKLDKARTKVIYTYNANAEEIEQCSERWSIGCQNIPSFKFGRPKTLFPIESAKILNYIMKQDGQIIEDKVKTVPRYHGMELFFGQDTMAMKDIHDLATNVTKIAPYWGSVFLRPIKEKEEIVAISRIKKTVALLGLLLHKLNSRKESYMQKFPYLLGQLLKVSDELHVMYCRVVRNNDVPPLLVGSSMYIAATEQPYRTLAQLGQRMNPYITWAKSYRTKGIQDNGKESGIVGWYLSLYQDISNQLYEIWNPQTRLTDVEKAQLFIGYLASFPKKEKMEHTVNNEIGGTTNA